MQINEVFDRLNFFINKYTGAFYTIPELEDLTDAGSLGLYSDLKPKYATSQLIKDSLSPFRRFFDFTPSGTISGYIVVPDLTYLDLLDIQISFQISGRTMLTYCPVKMINEDERANRLNSQIDPVTITSPIGEQTAPRYFRLYPLSGYTGTVTYLRRPIKPVFGYSVVSGRIIVYDPATSIQLEWRDSEINAIILKSLQIAGINLSDAELLQFSEQKSQGNFSQYTGTTSNQNRL